MNLPITVTVPWPTKPKYKSNSPKEVMKPWLIENVGAQHHEWDWMYFPSVLNNGAWVGYPKNLVVSFKTEKAAMLFVMTFT